MIICMPERLDEFMDELNDESKKCIGLYSDAKLTYFEEGSLQRLQHGEDKIRGEKGNKVYRNQKPGKHGDNEITVYNSDEKLRENKSECPYLEETRHAACSIDASDQASYFLFLHVNVLDASRLSHTVRTLQLLFRVEFIESRDKNKDISEASRMAEWPVEVSSRASLSVLIPPCIIMQLQIPVMSRDISAPLFHFYSIYTTNFNGNTANNSKFFSGLRTLRLEFMALCAWIYATVLLAERLHHRVNSTLISYCQKRSWNRAHKLRYAATKHSRFKPSNSRFDAVLVACYDTLALNIVNPERVLTSP
ncbi:hypothetical protein RRG08_014466 [Elysia crispata]|uniref:Uncharacterized protein n=1 Tax=Elysia crispata TaxID=231223 RepID=A0AAE0Y5R6_9GAST|nr:hypothetical protein RRG08_014466 [Elysia crispata]